MSIYDINPGQCEDSLSIIDHDRYGKTILPNEDQLNGVKLLSASNKIKIQLTSCYQFQRNNQKSFELKVSTIGVYHSIIILSIKCEGNSGTVHSKSILLWNNNISICNFRYA